MTDTVAEAKASLRADLIAARSAMDPEVRVRTGSALAARVHDDLVPLGGRVVCCYASVGAEPPTDPLLDALVAAGSTVLLPVTPPGRPTTLRWARYTGPDDLVAGRFGLREPAGDHLADDAIGSADVILVPALAVDRRGTRLGRGAGYYDRSIGGLDAVRIAVVYDHEILDEVPGDPHDVAMTWALTPGDGFVGLG